MRGGLAVGTSRPWAAPSNPTLWHSPQHPSAREEAVKGGAELGAAAAALNVFIKDMAGEG